MGKDRALKYKRLHLEATFRRPMIGLGAQARSSLALGLGKEVFVSCPHEDLNLVSGYGKFETILKDFIRFSGAKTFAFDLHPAYNYQQLIHDYQLKGGSGIRFIGVQHHQAHIGACILEHSINDQVIGIAFDGTGFGLDGNLWGGEFFLGGLNGFKRSAHLSFMPLAGGQEAILEPWRLGAAALAGIYKDKLWDLKIDFLKTLDKKKWSYLEKMLANKLNCPLSSSAGRLFDCVSALLGLVKGRIAYEAEGPIKLEALAKKFNYNNLSGLTYVYSLIKKGDHREIDTSGIIRGIVSDLQNSVAAEKIAFKFHNSLARIILDTALALRRDSGINRVVLSGGVFANKLLSSLAQRYLSQKGLRVYEHSLFSPGDESICVGQVGIANSQRS